MVLLKGYGADGMSFDPGFNSVQLPLIDRGMIYGIAHVRGGGDLGMKWHEDGRLLNKKSSFLDLIACAERLIQDGYTCPDRLSISGGSAGGLLVAAAANLRPELFGAVIADAPFVDPLNGMLDDGFWLAEHLKVEFGDPSVAEHYHNIKSYSPYENIRKTDYPAMLVRSGFNDIRVRYWQPAKWVARLRANKTDTNRLLLCTRMEAGHLGAPDIYARIRDYVFQAAFLIDTLGLKE